MKCTSTIKQITPKEAIETGKLKFATIHSQGNLQLKKRSFYYFIIWSPKANYNVEITNKYWQ